MRIALLFLLLVGCGQEHTVYVDKPIPLYEVGKGDKVELLCVGNDGKAKSTIGYYYEPDDALMVEGGEDISMCTITKYVED